MMFNGTCGFCRCPGHTIATCTHPEKEIVIRLMETDLDILTSRIEITRYVSGLSPVRVQLLSTRLNVNNGMPRVLMRKMVVDYYYRRNTFREHRAGRIEEEPPTVSRVGRFEQLMTVLRKWIREGFLGNGRYAPVPLEQEMTETYTFARGWRILPNLYRMESCATIECPICMESVEEKMTVKTECNHQLCGQCFINYVDKGPILHAPVCPLCRAEIKTVDMYDDKLYSSCVAKYIK